MKDINILITGIGGAGFGEQILKALKMSDLNLFIIGTDITDICFNKRNVNKFLVIPSAYDESYNKVIKELINSYDIKAIFPGSEPELQYFSNNIEEFKDIYVGINSNELIKLCSNKFSTYEKLSQLGLSVPKYEKINTIDDCKKIDYFPVILKPNTNSGGSAHIYISFDMEELKMFSGYMLKHGIDIIAQEYIGDSNNEYTIGVSSDKNGNILGSIILKRIINNGLSTNKRAKLNDINIVISSGISQGEFIFNDNIKEQAENIAKKIDSRGPINIQGRVVDGKLLIFEINPRLSGTTSLRAMVGYNEPANMIKQNILHENVIYNYNNGVVLRSIVENVDMDKSV
ncbi:ATP-grasp domain-containing protein [Clostridium nigeriense]|uniref:ATP-grasp domain-containing protein n=1 Tax=Clostridium nigeriense TaxID=1805470 RepID=UPI0008337634|nr:ATP-grasp domain-containing protein [Clostridium nigeriense]